MLIRYYKNIYQCKKVNIGGQDYYRGQRLFKNGRLGKHVKFFVPGAAYYEIMQEGDINERHYQNLHHLV
jgi:hypothetical protein